MNKEEIRRILSLRKNKSQSLKKLFKKESPKLFEEIISLPIGDSFSEKLYLFLHDMSEPPKCRTCQTKDVKFIDFTNGYRKCCSRKCSNQDDGRVAKIRQTNLQRYGATCPLENESIKKKSLNTLKRNFGSDITNPGQLRKGKRTLVLNWLGFLFENPERNGDCTPLFTKEDYLEKGSRFPSFSFRCNTCQTRFETYLLNGHIPKCPTCYPRPSKSKQEVEVIQFIRTFYDGRLIRSNRSILKDTELDLLIPDLSLAIEFNGNYWHSEKQGKGRSYHLSKTNRCLENNIQLIHIFESEWMYKKPIIQSIIRAKFGSFERRIFARKCQVVELDPKAKTSFLTTNHLQGDDKSSVRLGLVYDEELVAIMTFCKARFNKNYEWEMSRFCSELGVQVPGGASRLLRHFYRGWDPKSIITYADRRFSNGNLYRQIGFEFSHMSPPNYFYWRYDCDGLLSRIRFQKHKLERVLERFDPELSEWQNMLNNGFDRVWDCGNLVFTWTLYKYLEEDQP